MKKQGTIILVTVILSAFLWSCTKNDAGLNNLSLKQSINQSALNLNSAMTAITSTQAYSILTVNDGLLKSATIADPVYKVYITLDTVKGVYDYKPVPKTDRWGWSLMKYFKKTADNSKMIVRMPLKKVKSPRSLRLYVPADSALTNNFVIAVSDYHNNYNSYHDFDYILNSEISVDNVVAGNLNIKYIVSPVKGVDYASQYAFAGSYTADYKYLSGDTTVSSFAITGNSKVLYEEKLLTVRNDTVRFGREHQYILTVGDVQIVRKSGTKGVAVYLKGVLQTNAVVAIVDKEADPEASVCKKRDIQITFDDGTSTTISALIGGSVDNIKTLFDSLHSVYFAAYVVDWIAYDIYYKRN
jgi:hypothetical protein